MAKIQYPPQGGEKKICMSLCCMALCSVISAVLMIYFTFIIYIPGASILESKIEGGKKCTTLLTEMGLEGEEECSVRDTTYGILQNDTMILPKSLWHTCNEWCLAKSPNECNHVWASVREVGTELRWNDCKMDEEAREKVENKGVDCNILEDEKELNCKLYPGEKGIIPFNPAKPAAEPTKFVDGGNKDRCQKFDDKIISCINGLCTVFSNVYSCTFNSTLDDIIQGREKDGDVDPIWEDLGYCLCTKCNATAAGGRPFPGQCPDVSRNCVKWYPEYPNNTSRKYCDEWVPCSDCKSICLQRRQCFDMKSRKDPTLIGVNDKGVPTQAFYHCIKGFCAEIYNLKCERKCMIEVNDPENGNLTQHQFENLGQPEGKNALIFNGENVMAIRCGSVTTSEGKDIEFDNDEQNVLMVACSEIENGNGSIARGMITKDCINGTWFPEGHFESSTNYSHVINEFKKSREIEENHEKSISMEADLVIYNRTKLMHNIDGCVNTLSDACKPFFLKHGRDGRNYTARAIYDCYYDPTEKEMLEKANSRNYPTTVIYKSSIFLFEGKNDPRLYLMIFSIIPGTILVFSCIYLIVCSKIIDVADDGHMRLKCCGKIVTGIGNVPPYEVPRKRKTEYRNPLMDGGEMN